MVRALKRCDGSYLVMDSARALAAVTVVVSHARDLLLEDAKPGLRLAARIFYVVTGFGHEAVMIFFVLSGYWISRSVVGRTSEPAPFWSGYLADRLTRLWTVLIPALLVGAILDGIGMGLGLPGYSGATGAHSIPAPITLRPLVLLGNVAFLQTLWVPVFGSNGPLWSLAYEFWFYIWFPALWLLLRHGRISVALASLGLTWLNPALLEGFAAWLVGWIVFMAHQRFGRDGDRVIAGLVLTAVGIVASCAALLAARMSLAGPLASITLAAAFGIALLGILLRPLAPAAALAPLARFGARSSFSIYAIHFPILMLMIGALPRRLPAGIGSVTLVVAATVLAIVAGWLFSLLTEARTTLVRSRLHRLIAPGPRGVRANFAGRFDAE